MAITTTKNIGGDKDATAAVTPPNASESTQKLSEDGRQYIEDRDALAKAAADDTGPLVQEVTDGYVRKMVSQKKWEGRATDPSMKGWVRADGVTDNSAPVLTPAPAVKPTE